ARKHTLRDEMRGLLGGAALAVDTRRRHAPRKPGRDPGVARDVAALLTGLRDAPADDVIDASGVEVVSFDHRAEHEPEQIRGVPSRQSALALAERGACTVDDHCLAGHGLTLGGHLFRPARPNGAGARAYGPSGADPAHSDNAPRRVRPRPTSADEERSR